MYALSKQSHLIQKTLKLSLQFYQLFSVLSPYVITKIPRSLVPPNDPSFGRQAGKGQFTLSPVQRGALGWIPSSVRVTMDRTMDLMS